MLASQVTRFMKLVVIIPTLKADRALDDCLASLGSQTFTDFETIVVANGLTKRELPVKVIRNVDNVGYGKAVNQGIKASTADFILALNDDTVLHPQCLEHLVAAMDSRYEIGM